MIISNVLSYSRKSFLLTAVRVVLLFDYVCNHVVVSDVRHSYFVARFHFHGAFDGEHGGFVSCPASTSYAVVDVPVEHAV